ncbi:MAG: hypothetical protein ACI39T_00895 [Candidatus Cryptobacteroides sp.]
MHPVRERFIRGKLMPHYLECLSNYTKINVKESDLLSPSISDGILKRLHQLRTQEQYHEITPVDSFELQRILESVFNQGEELIIWIKDADICGMLKIPDFRSINTSFDLCVDNNGVLSIFDAGLTRKVTIDYCPEDDNGQTREGWIAYVTVYSE